MNGFLQISENSIGGMFQRPVCGETEDDLLRQQEQYFKVSGMPSKSGNKELSEEKKNLKQSSKPIVLDIVEKNDLRSSKNFKFEIQQDMGFPRAFYISSCDTSKKKTSKSLFAVTMEQKQYKSTLQNVVNSSECMSSNSDNTEMTISKIYSGSMDSTGITRLKKSIHNENVETLSKMSDGDILMKKNELFSSLHPDLIKFLQKKSQQVKGIGLSNNEDKYDNMHHISESHEFDSKWANIDFFEKKKLEWIGDIPEELVLEPNQPYSARFDFKGELLPFKTEIDVRTSLYHHGDEPERPGYTIQELYQLSRSQVLQQRILALKTLAYIIQKAKLGYYDICFGGSLLHRLLDSDLFFLLRFSVDDNATVPASVLCLHNLLCNECDEFCLDKLLGVSGFNKQPLLYVESKVNKEEEGELKDHILISYDLIKGVLRTDLLGRLSYILNNCSPSQETTVRILNCLIRISRHSKEASLKILCTPNLLRVVCTNLQNQKPLHVSIKLCRVMTEQSFEIAKAIMNECDIRFLVSFLEQDEIPEVTKKEHFLLKLETLYLWKNFLIHRLYVNEFISWSPNLIRLLVFYTEKVDVSSVTEFDFELFSALVSLIIVCNKMKISQDSNVTMQMRICLEKWLIQLIQKQTEYNFSLSKALASILRYFVTHFKVFGVTTTDMEFITKINVILLTFFDSKIYDVMSSGLVKFSHILNLSTTGSRDPDCLPSLSSIYHGGGEFLKIVHHSSSLPFFVSLSKYLKVIFRISTKSEPLLKSFVASQHIRNYVKKFLKHQITIFNWFMRLETNFLYEILQLFVITRDSEMLSLCFRLLPALRIDDKKTFKIFDIVFDSKNWSNGSEMFPKQNISQYKELLLKNDRHCQCYKSDLLPEEWPYKMLALLKDTHDNNCIVGTLRFISYVLRRFPSYFDAIDHTYRYYYTCYVFLVDSLIFDETAQNELEIIFKDIIANKEKVNLRVKLVNRKAFYDLYTELITQYAGVSYGLSIFARFVLFPLQNNYDVAFRKLIWFEYLHVLRVVTLSFPVNNFIKLKDFVEPCENDESLLVAYVNSISGMVITKIRNPFIYNIAIGNINNILVSQGQNQKLTKFLTNKIDMFKNLELRNDILNFRL